MIDGASADGLDFDVDAILDHAGDRSGKARNGIIGNSTSAEVESAETGAAGFEIGAGISVPVGSQSGSVFMDASFEWRDGWSSVDASAGYRVSF